MRPALSPLPAKLPRTLILRLAGSDAVDGQLARRLASGYLATIGDSEVSLAQGGADHADEISGVQGGRREAISIVSRPPGGGLAALLHGTADMALSTKRIAPAEAELLSSLDDMTSPANEAIVGVQGVVAVVGRANRTSSLTASQLRGILAGHLTDWSQVGAAPGAIQLYVVNDRDGAADTPQDVLAGLDGVAGTAHRVADEQAVVAAVAADSAGIGFTTFGNTGALKMLSVAENGATAIAPSGLSISTETYPLSRRLYLYSSPGSPSPFARRFASYVASATGQSAVEAEGFAPLSIKAEPVVVPDTASERFKQLVVGATRLSVDFRFQASSTALDSHGVRDVALLVAYLKSQQIEPGRIILAGFADTNGSPAANQAVSQRRVEAVVAALGKAGIAPGKIATFGAELPVADNATLEGRERNRRVEVYLMPAPEKTAVSSSRTIP